VQWIASFILKRAGTIALIGTLLAIAGGYYSVQLYKNLRTEIQELLPTTARSVLDLHEVSQRLESIDNLAVLVFSKDTQASKRFVIDLAHLLERAPPTTIASVDYRIDTELKFFKDRQALFLDLTDLIKIRNYIEKRVDYEKELYNPLNIFKAEYIPEPRLDFIALKHKYTSKTAVYENLPEGFYATPDQTKRVLLVNMPGQSTGIASAHRLRNFVKKSLAELNPTAYAPDIEVKFTGGVEDTIEEQEALVADLELSTVIVTILVTVAMLVYFRTVRATMALIISLFMGTLWTFGASFFLVGYLNANSAFLGSIVIGNGINFGIIFLARYIEERRKDETNESAIRTSMTQTATSTGTAALAAGLSYGSLMLTGFRGFKQFGVIGLVGMLLCWLSAFTLLPAFLTLMERFGPIVKPHKKQKKSTFGYALAYLVGHFPKIIFSLSIALTLVSLATLTQFSPKILETDLTKLRNKDSMTKGSAFLSQYLDEIFRHYLSPLVILPHSRENAIKIVQLLKERKAQEGPTSLIASVQTLADFIPARQKQKVAVIKDIRALLPPRLLRRLTHADQLLVSEFLTEGTLRPFTEKDLPPLVLRKFTEKDGSIGKMVLVEPPLTNETKEADNLIRFVGDLRAIADSVEPGTAVAGTMTITSDMIKAISHDGPRATLFAFIAVVVLVIVLFRHLSSISLVLFSLFLGVTWLAGLILGFDIKINFLNFIALPITFGIGVDYGVNIFQRYRESHGESILTVIQNTGSAVALCSFSTIVGYTSLLIAGNQGFVSFGTLAVAGELTCVIAAIISLPAFLIWREKHLGKVKLE
jgi:predicted RND superfamily exporter protein